MTAAPVEKSIVVRCSVAHAFRVFTEKVDLWWPPGHRKDPNSEFFFESGEGGRFGEKLPSGEERLLGQVLVWDPPAHLVYNWWPGAIEAPTQVDVSFTALDEGTRVDVRHSIGDSGLGELWPERAALFTRSWARVLAAYGVATEE